MPHHLNASPLVVVLLASTIIFSHKQCLYTQIIISVSEPLSTMNLNEIEDDTRVAEERQINPTIASLHSCHWTMPGVLSLRQV